MEANYGKWLVQKKSVLTSKKTMKAMTKLKKDTNAATHPVNLFVYWAELMYENDQEKCLNDFAEFQEWYYANYDETFLRAADKKDRECRKFHKDAIKEIAVDGNNVFKRMDKHEDLYTVCQMCKKDYKPNPYYDPRYEGPESDCIPISEASEETWTAIDPVYQLETLFYEENDCPNVPAGDDGAAKRVTVCDVGYTLHPAFRVSCPASKKEWTADSKLNACIEVKVCDDGQVNDWDTTAITTNSA
jgi:hypothetical protein